MDDQIVWEYDAFPIDDSGLLRMLQLYGRDGWELVQILDVGTGDGLHGIKYRKYFPVFKRQVPFPGPPAEPPEEQA